MGEAFLQEIQLCRQKLIQMQTRNKTLPAKTTLCRQLISKFCLLYQFPNPWNALIAPRSFRGLASIPFTPCIPPPSLNKKNAVEFSWINKHQELIIPRITSCFFFIPLNFYHKFLQLRQRLCPCDVPHSVFIVLCGSSNTFLISESFFLFLCLQGSVLVVCILILLVKSL